MTQAERIREYYRDNPTASYDEVAEAVKTSLSNVKANVSRDVSSNKAIRIEGGGVDYSYYFNSEATASELRKWKNDIRHELVDQMLRAIRAEVNTEKIRMLSKEINYLLKEITE